MLAYHVLFDGDLCNVTFVPSFVKIPQRVGGVEKTNYFSKRMLSLEAVILEK
jgi:hypothetical protein